MVEETKAVTLATRARQTVSFIVSKGTEGDYSVEIDGKTGKFTVSPALSEVTSEAILPPTAPSKANWLLIGGIIFIVLIIVCFRIIWRRARS
jgi:hypothetical protein